MNPMAKGLAETVGNDEEQYELRPSVEWKSPRLEHGRCQPHAEKSFRPLEAILPEHTSPEMLYLEVKWSSLLPYEVSYDLLHDVLPVNEKLSAVTLRHHLNSERMDSSINRRA
jgi:hypothetical protein